MRVLQWVLLFLSIPFSAIGFIGFLQPKKREMWRDNFGLDDAHMWQDNEAGIWTRVFTWSFFRRIPHYMKGITATWCDSGENGHRPAQRPAKFFSFIITIQWLVISWLIL